MLLVGFELVFVRATDTVRFYFILSVFVLVVSEAVAIAAGRAQLGRRGGLLLLPTVGGGLRTTCKRPTTRLKEIPSLTRRPPSRKSKITQHATSPNTDLKHASAKPHMIESPCQARVTNGNSFNPNFIPRPKRHHKLCPPNIPETASMIKTNPHPRKQFRDSQTHHHHEIDIPPARDTMYFEATRNE